MPAPFQPDWRDLLRGIFATEPRNARISQPSAHFALGTDLGKVRRENQDRIAVLEWPSIQDHPGALFALVCDGMGGMKGGGEAAAITATTFIRSALDARCELSDDWIEEAAQEANRAVWQRLRGDGGAVFVAVLLSQKFSCVVHAGDARAYALDEEGRALRVTRDHVVPGDRGILNFVGMGPDFAVEVTPLPTNYLGLLLTSDGATAGVEDHPTGLLSRLWQHNPPSELLAHLFQTAQGVGGMDNATAFCIENRGPSSKPAPSDQTFVQLWTPELRPLRLPLPRPPRDVESRPQQTRKPQDTGRAQKTDSRSDRDRHKKGPSKPSRVDSGPPAALQQGMPPLQIERVPEPTPIPTESVQGQDMDGMEAPTQMLTSDMQESPDSKAISAHLENTANDVVN